MPDFIVNWFEIGSKLSLNDQEWYFLKTSFSKASSVTDESMGRWKSFIVAFVGLGIATGVGVYLYRNVRRKNGEEEISESSASQVQVQINRKKATFSLNI